MTERLPQFFMVLNDRSTQTRYRHDTLESARAEAKRLAGLNPGVKFWVLAALGCCIKPDPVEWIPTDDIPF